MFTDDKTNPSISSEKIPDVSASDRIDPQSFPHLPKPGGGLPATIENVGHLLTETGFTARFNVIKKRLEVRRGGKPASMNQVASAATRRTKLNTRWRKVDRTRALALRAA